MKALSTKFVCVAALSLAANALLFTLTTHAQSEGQEAWSQQYRVQYEVPRGIYTGRSPYMSPMGQSEAAPVVVTAQPAPAAPRPAKTSCSDPTWGLIRMSKTMPPEVTLGSEFVAELKITAAACAGNVVVRDVIPASATYVKSEPVATVDGNTLTWKVGDMDAGQTTSARIWLRADKEGTIANCATVSADPRVCAATIVGKPVLAIEKTGPATARVGSEVAYNIVVKNTGSTMARNVVVTDPVPEGYSSASGQSELTIHVGDLAPGQSKALTVTFKANKRGKICNVATASSSNADKVSDEACTVIQQPGLKIEKTGTKEQITGRKADYQITVSNTGDAELANVSVVDIAPEGTELVAAPGASISGNKATWTINLAPEGKQTFDVTVLGKAAGNRCNTVSASAEGLSESAEACTVWKGIAGILLEVVDDPDPIQVGESTTYTIKVVNQGFADIHNVKLVASYDDRIEPVKSPEGNISGKSVTFPTVSVIEPKKAINYTVVVKGVKAGDTRNKVVLTCDELTSEVEETESTTVY
jgi:uncharacterized repeat protein (TIGR01451 family)